MDRVRKRRREIVKRPKLPAFTRAGLAHAIQGLKLQPDPLGRPIGKEAL